MALASERSIPCFERAMLPEEVPDMEEAFTTSTLREVMPLVEINGQPVGTGRSGEVTRVLMKAYRELVSGDCGLRSAECGVRGGSQSEIRNPKSEIGRGETYARHTPGKC